MAIKKPSRKAASKKFSKSKRALKKKPMAKKGKVISNPKGKKKKSKQAKTSVKAKITKALKKKTPSSKVISRKKKVVARKAVSKKRKMTTKKNIVKSGSRPKAKKTATKKLRVQKRKTPVGKKNMKSSERKKQLLKGARSSAASVSQHLPKPKSTLLSSTERYNIGGLFMCVIDQSLDQDSRRLQAVFRHLGLSSMEKENLFRLSQGFMIPKLFADSVASEKVRLALTDLVKFALGEGAYENKWREEIRQVGLWLGFFPEQVEEIEQQVMATR